MAVEVERLLVSLEARITQFEKNMDRASRSASKATALIERDASRMQAKLTSSFNAAGGALKAGLVGFAAGAAGALSVSAITDTVAALAKLQDVAERTGVSTDAIQKFGYAVEQSGGEIDDVYSGLQKFAVNLSKAAAEGGDLAKILAANGVALKDANGQLRPLSDLLADYADLVANAQSEQDKLNLAATAFGKSAGPALVLALGEGKKGLADLGDEAQKAGVVIDSQIVKKAGKLDDAFTKLKSQIADVGSTLIVQFAAPALQSAMEDFLKLLREAQELITAIQNHDLSKLVGLTGGGLLGAFNPPVDQGATKAELEGQAADIRKEIATIEKSSLQPDISAPRIANLKKDLAEIEAQIRKINATPVNPGGAASPGAPASDFTPSRAGLTAGSPRPTVIPTSGADLDIPIGNTIVDRIIRIESGGDRFAKNSKSSASGTGQFIDKTFLELFKKEFATQAAGLSDSAILAFKTNAEVNRKLIEAYAKENAGVLARAGIAITDANLYLAHFLGPGGAVKILQANPNASAASVLGAGAAKANPSIIGGGKTAQDVINFANRKVDTARIAANDLTPQEERDKDVKGAIRDSEERTAALQRESEALNQNAYAKAFAAEKARLLADVERDGVKASPEEVALIDAQSAAYARKSAALDNLERATNAVRDAQQEFADLGADAVKGFVGDLKQGVSAADALRNALDRILSRLTDNLIDSLFQGLFAPAKGGGGGGLFGNLLGSLFGGFGGARAGGGDVQSGKAYLVGEKRPELFVPGRSGTIVPKIAAPISPVAVPSARGAAPLRVNHNARILVDVSGANGDDSIRRIANEAAATGARQAYAQAMKDVPGRNARQQRLGY